MSSTRALAGLLLRWFLSGAALTASSALAAATAPQAEAPPRSTEGRPRLLVLDLTPSAGVEERLASAVGEAVAAEASRTGYFQVSTQRDVALLLGLERQRELVGGCGEQSESCLVELAGALGARFVLSGSLARLGDAYQLSLQTLDSHRAVPLARSVRLARDLNALREAVPFALAEATATPPPAPPSKLLPYSLMGGGALFAAGGAVLAVVALSREQALASELALAVDQPALVLKPVAYYREQEARLTEQKLGAAALVVTGAALSVAGVVLNRKAETSVGVVLSPAGGAATLRGVWP